MLAHRQHNSAYSRVITASRRPVRRLVVRPRAEAQPEPDVASTSSQDQVRGLNLFRGTHTVL